MYQEGYPARTIRYMAAVTAVLVGSVVLKAVFVRRGTGILFEDTGEVCQRGEPQIHADRGRGLILFLDKKMTYMHGCAIIVKGDDYGKEIRN